MGTRLTTRRDWDSLWSGGSQLSTGSAWGWQLSVWDSSISGCSCCCSAIASCAQPAHSTQPAPENSTFESQSLQVIWDWMLNTIRLPTPIQYNSLQRWSVALSFQVTVQDLICHLGAGPYCQCCMLLTPSGLSWCLTGSLRHIMQLFLTALVSADRLVQINKLHQAQNTTKQTYCDFSCPCINSKWKFLNKLQLCLINIAEQLGEVLITGLCYFSKKTTENLYDSSAFYIHTGLHLRWKERENEFDSSFNYTFCAHMQQHKLAGVKLSQDAEYCVRLRTPWVHPTCSAAHSVSIIWGQ